ncbi:MAG: T9SS type A sorting domain-containing protein [candidate division WOR-3 bacterium]
MFWFFPENGNSIRHFKVFFIFLLFLIKTTNFAKENEKINRGIKPPFNLKEIVEQVNNHRRRNHPNLKSEKWGSESGEFLIDTNITYITADDDQTYPAVAFDGTNYFVVWQDGFSEDERQIFGARVNQDGIVLDTAGIAISIARLNQSNPAVTFDGTNYLVVWEDYRSRFESDIYGARVSPTGEVLDPDGIAISTAFDIQCPPSVASNGTNSLVVWEDARSGGGHRIYGARVSPTGEVLDPDGILIANGPYVRWPSVASDGSNYLVVWDYDYDIYGTRVNKYGVVLDTNYIVISNALSFQSYPSVSFGDSNYFVVWQDYRDGDFNIYGARLSKSGTVLDSNGIAISTAPGYQKYPVITFNGTNYLVVWTDYRSGSDIYGARVTQAGVVLDPTGIHIFNPTVAEEPHPAVVFGLDNYLIVTENEDSYGFNDIYGVRVTPTGIVIDTNGIAISAYKANRNRFHAVAFDGTNYLVVWEDWRSNYADIYGARVNQAGLVLDAISIPITTANQGQYKPSVVFGGTNYLVVWADGRNIDTANNTLDIYGARVSPAGIVLDTSGIAISTAAGNKWSPSVAFDGTNYLVVWTDYRSGVNSDIYGARVNQTGVVLDTDGFAISNAPLDQEYPTVAFDGFNYLVVWQDVCNMDDIYGARVSQAGVVLDTNGIVISSEWSAQWRPSVAFDGTNYFVVWMDWRSGLPNIYGARVNQAGVVLDTNGIPISPGAYHQRDPAITFDGTNYLVVWEDGRSWYDSDIYGALLSPSGTVIEEFPVSTQLGLQRFPALAHGIGNQALIIYTGWTGTVQGKTYSTYRTWGKLYPGPGIEENQRSSITNQTALKIYPNPFSKQTVINFTQKVSHIEIYDVSGKLVKSFFTTRQSLSTSNCIIWDGTDNYGRKLPSGVYLLYLKTSNNETKASEIIILR